MIKIIVAFHNFANARTKQYLNRSRGNFRNVMLTFYDLFNDDANACYCRVWTELERLWKKTFPTQLTIPSWVCFRLRKTTKTSAPSEIQSGDIPNTSQKRCATASVLHIKYLSHNSKCPKNNAISVEKVTNTHWKRLWNYTVTETDWNLIIPYRVSKLIGGELKKNIRLSDSSYRNSCHMKNMRHDMTR